MKSIFFIALAGVIVAIFLTYTLADFTTESENIRYPSSIPENYQLSSACDKQDMIWEQIKPYQSLPNFTKLPDYPQFGIKALAGLIKQHIKPKTQNTSDFVPVGWKKHIHRRGSIAKVKIVPQKSSYTGVFQGAECAFLRLSLAYHPDRAVAPGLALKVFRDGTYSANVSALVSLTGQEQDYNFFKHPMSNIVPIVGGKAKIVHMKFSTVSSFPEELLLNDMAGINPRGEKASEVVAPRQLFFVPGPNLNFSSDKHDPRDDFAKIPKDSLIYQVYSAPSKYNDFDYHKYTDEMVLEFLKESQHIADIVSTSEFVSSEFSDDILFFKHESRP